MKKMILIMGAALFLFACNSAGDSDNNLSSDSLQNSYENNDSMNNMDNNTDTGSMPSDSTVNRQDQPNP
ncbi:hypothetical protein [Agriterribacter sp.]|uniref:hypothetical protein n=1 Tax=Agriterribacter sp. TaxID=2821509 RepID=UPI002BE0B24B|nr:hypothetical protein [Agriterribacter sp.]HRP57037.1 hypothetical protein [Agriterribacter sp.]